MRQTLKSALVAAVVSAAIAAPAAYSAGESQTDLRQDHQISLLQTQVKANQGDILAAYRDMNQLQCEIENGANASVCA